MGEVTASLRDVFIKSYSLVLIEIHQLKEIFTNIHTGMA